MQRIDEFLAHFIKELDYKPIKTMFESIKQGKRLRSKLILAIAQSGTKALNVGTQALNSGANASKCAAQSDKKSTNDDFYKLCAIVEFIHLASLLHDDIIDEAELRRGAKSVNAEFGAKNALMMGDILYSYAFCELTKFPKEVAYSISNAVTRLAKGELMDIELSKSFNTDEKAYLTMIELKTAALIEASAFSAAHLAGLDAQKFGEYGKNLGLAFQIIDDILDIKNDEKTLGKPAMSDFKEGKSTICYISLFKELNYNEKQILQDLFKKDLNQSELAWLKDKFKEHKIIEKTSKQAKDFGLKAIKAVEGFENSALKDIVLKMIDREF